MEIQPRFPIGMKLYVEGGSIRLYAKQNRVLIVQRRSYEVIKTGLFSFLWDSKFDKLRFCSLRTHFQARCDVHFAIGNHTRNSTYVLNILRRRTCKEESSILVYALEKLMFLIDNWSLICPHTSLKLVMIIHMRTCFEWSTLSRKAEKNQVFQIT